MRSVGVVVGGALIGLAAVWHFVLSERWTQRIPQRWEMVMRYSGSAVYPDPVTGAFPPSGRLSEWTRRTRVVNEDQRPHAVVIEDYLGQSQLGTNHLEWEYSTRAIVDPRTGERLEPAFRGQYALFPRNVEQRVYRIRSNYLKDTPVSFEQVDRIEGLELWVFRFHGRGEYTDSYRGSDKYAGESVAPGQEIKCADDQFFHRVWVEPVTGSVAKVEEGCPSGDYVYDISSGKRLRAVARWDGIMGGDQLIRRLDEVRDERARYLWTARYFPLLLLTAGVLALGAGVRKPRQRMSA